MGFDIGDIGDALGAVAGSGEDVAKAVKFVAEHGDDVLNLIKQVPEILAATAATLTDAAEDVGAAAGFLTGGEGKGAGVKSVAELAGAALDTCRKELGSAQGLLDTVARQFADLPIPDGGIGEKIGDAAKRFDQVGDQLAEVAKQLRSLGVSVDNAGQGLARTAGKLEQGGKAIGRFSD